MTALRLGERDLAHTIGKQIGAALGFSTLNALGQQYQISGDSTDELKLGESYWQCIRLRGQSYYLYTSYRALKAFFAGLTGLSKTHNGIMFHDCLYQLLVDETLPVSDRCLEEVIQDLVGFSMTTNRYDEESPACQFPLKTGFTRHLLLSGPRECWERLCSYDSSSVHENITKLYEDLKKDGQIESNKSLFEQIISIGKEVQKRGNECKRKRQDSLIS